MKAQDVELGRSRWESLAGDLSELFKVRLSFLVVLTTLVGFLLGSQGPLDYFLLLTTLAGTALAAAGASALNQWMERTLDARMARTQSRPLPGGRMHPEDALWMGALLSLAGLALLYLFVNELATILTALTLGSYLLVYTPLKRRTALNTLVGAIPGAIPPLIGWVAATGRMSLTGWVLFAILFLWQMPHFLAISWMYRDEYRDAGFRMLSAEDPDGSASGRQSLIYSLALLVASLLPSVLRVASPWYMVPAFLLGVGFVACAANFAIRRTRGSARLLFFASILYLPLLLGALVLTKQ